MLLKDAQMMRVACLSRVVTPMKNLNSLFLGGNNRRMFLSDFHGLQLKCSSEFAALSPPVEKKSPPLNGLEVEKSMRSRETSDRNPRNPNLRKDAGERNNVDDRLAANKNSNRFSSVNLRNDSENHSFSPSNVSSVSEPYSDERTFSTTVPRPSHLRDYEWTQADVKVVKSALNQSEHLVPKLTADVNKIGSNQFLLGRNLEELQDLAVEFEEQKYRGKQLYQFIYKNKGTDLMKLEMLPKRFRESLIERGFEIGRLPVHHILAANDGTAKLLMRLEDNRLVETVGIPNEEKSGLNSLTACVSSQVGCPLKCSFCATGKGGFARNLKPHEIVSQVMAIEELFQHRVNNVVFMGMGEPMLNLPSVLAAVKCLNKDIGIGQRMITISTVGVPNTITRFANHKLQSTLAISLHAPNQALREMLVPSAKSYPLDALLKDCQDYFAITNRRVSFEYTLLAGVNDQVSHANELADLLYRYNLAHHVNLIPFNPISDSDFRRPSKAYVLQFLEALTKRKVNASVRRTRGMEANAACGQLRNQFQKNPIEDIK